MPSATQPTTDQGGGKWRGSGIAGEFVVFCCRPNYCRRQLKFADCCHRCCQTAFSESPWGRCRLSIRLNLAPRAGFEPATNRLTAGCSTAELPGNSSCRARNAYNKAGPALKAAKRRKSRCDRLGLARAGSPSRSSRQLARPAFAQATAWQPSLAARAKAGGHARN
jgi:hypothetical protein